MKKHLWLAALLASLLLAGCGEKEQVMRSSAARPDAQPWEGGNSAFTVPGWTVGDQASWERQMRNRNQLQNEYVRIN